MYDTKFLKVKKFLERNLENAERDVTWNMYNNNLLNPSDMARRIDASLYDMFNKLRLLFQRECKGKSINEQVDLYLTILKAVASQVLSIFQEEEYNGHEGAYERTNKSEDQDTNQQIS